MNATGGLRVEALRAIAECPASEWDACANPGSGEGARPVDPFVTHRFLAALEVSGSASVETGWMPCHLLARGENGALLGAMPMYVKEHSLGEFVFDQGWAEAFASVGGEYYPKLLVAVPFTAVSGRRLLLRPNLSAREKRTVGQALVDVAIEQANLHGLSSMHMNFCGEFEVEITSRAGFLHRQGIQYHWCNRGYRDFGEFAAGLTSRRRKQILRERAAIRESGLQIETFEGEGILPEHWEAFWEFYQDTGTRHWGDPYLTRAFFDEAHHTLRGEAVMFLARNGNRRVAGALSFRGRNALFGRYWGCTEDVPFLHFELCYYRSIDYAIEAGLDRIEAGAGGGHKLLRGYRPVTTHSMHWIAHAGLRMAVERFLVAERAGIRSDSERLDRYGGYRREAMWPGEGKGAGE